MTIPKRDRITVQINQEIRDLLEQLHGTEELKSPLVRKSLHLGLVLITLAEKLKLPVPKPNELLSWLNDYGFTPTSSNTRKSTVEEFVKNLSNGNRPSNTDLALLAKELDMDVKHLTRIRDAVIESNRKAKGISN
ncbi:MAG: hypothetical protein PUP92_14785 [Rhizonema sp. PD38]|nr:hypothetical protein [Rhizonema sp. PD38]